MPNQLISGNWKMHLELKEALELARSLKNRVRNNVDRNVSICPPYPYLEPIARILADSPVEVGAQDIDIELSGARTGAVSAPMIRSVGCTFTLVGHSERRSVFGDTDQVVATKLRTALAHDLNVILCVGESLSEREAGKTSTVVLSQLDHGLGGLSSQQMTHIVIAYEPVWAIGTGLTATPAQAQEVHAQIRNRLKELFDNDIAESTRIQYGGSVKPENAAEILAQADVDGALVGGASLNAESFIQIVRARN
jgi:triosephosphate isomerase